MKTQIFFTVVAVLLCLQASAANNLKVILKSKESITYALAEKPVYWTSANAL